jgi:oxygen-dependent protoporphyrinogen oxidase
MFVTPRNGLSSIVHAIAGRLPQGAIRLNAPVEHIQRLPEGRWRLSASGGAHEFDAVILATSSSVAAKLVWTTDLELGRDLHSIEHSGTAIVTAAFARDQIAHPLDGAGVVVPALENSPILACSFSSLKYSHRAPEGQVLLLRVFAGGARRPDLAEMEDALLQPLLLAELSRLLGIRGEPTYTNCAHWPGTMPQYHVGHKALVARIEAKIGALPHLCLAGNAFHGVGIPHCIHSGEQAAEQALAATRG